jgi:hypothetical protein
VSVIAVKSNGRSQPQLLFPFLKEGDQKKKKKKELNIKELLGQTTTPNIVETTRH